MEIFSLFLFLRLIISVFSNLFAKRLTPIFFLTQNRSIFWLTLLKYNDSTLRLINQTTNQLPFQSHLPQWISPPRPDHASLVSPSGPHMPSTTFKLDHRRPLYAPSRLYPSRHALWCGSCGTRWLYSPVFPISLASYKMLWHSIFWWGGISDYVV